MIQQWITTFLLAMTPIGELRAAIPIALAVYKLSPWPVLFVAIAGNIIPVFFIYQALMWIERMIKSSLDKTLSLLHNGNREEFIKTILEDPQKIKPHLSNIFLLWGFTLYTFLLRRTARKYVHAHKQIAFLSLAAFVAIPLPMTGAWSGTVLAYLLGIPMGRAFPSILLGIGVAGLITTVLSLGGIALSG